MRNQSWQGACTQVNYPTLQMRRLKPNELCWLRTPATSFLCVFYPSLGGQGLGRSSQHRVKHLRDSGNTVSLSQE